MIWFYDSGDDVFLWFFDFFQLWYDYMILCFYTSMIIWFYVSMAIRPGDYAIIKLHIYIGK